MRASLIIAAHNESDRLWRTVASCVETSAGLDCEIVVADDASWDESVGETLLRFPQVRVVRHDERKGASPTKDLGARHARGEVLIFLDGHTKPEPGAIQRLIEDVERLKGEAIITPSVTGLCVTRWKTLPHQTGHGLSLELERLDSPWLPLSALREHRHRGRLFYESPALSGCAFAVHRELYDDLRGFDPHMLCWGVEDLDFGLKCWLMGHPILHDPVPVIGHRFQQRFDNFEVPVDQHIVNQLRMARKNFTEAVWSNWLARCRARNSGSLTEHPEGLWARVWELFGERRPSVEQERAHLLARRVHDEFWYAERFGLPWPKLQAEHFEPGMRAFEAGAEESPPTPSPSPSPTPPPCECKLTGITPTSSIICVGKNITFTAQGECLDNVSWSAPGGDPATGTGSSFTTKWDSTGDETVTAVCQGDDQVSSANVKVVAVDKVIVDGSDPEDEGPVEVKLGLSVDLRAKRIPAPPDGAWPDGDPKWEITQTPSPFAFGKLLPTTGGRVTFVPDAEGTWKVRAKCCSSEDEIEVTAVTGCSWIENVSADSCFVRVDVGPTSATTPMNVLGRRGSNPDDKVTLTITLKSGGSSSKVTWSGATQDGSNPLKATVPINQSVLKKVIVKYDGSDCREIRVWPVWTNVIIRIDGQLSPDNKASRLTDAGNWPTEIGGGNDLGPIDVWQNAGVTYKDALGRMEAVVVLSPPGVGEVIPTGKLLFRRKLTGIGWANAGHYGAGDTWFAGPFANSNNVDDTSGGPAVDVNPAGNDKLFDLDVPGQKWPAAYHTGEQYGNFVQYVTIDVCGTKELCSNEVPWSYCSRIDYDKVTNKLELNELKTSHITLPESPHYSKR